jgi:Na+/alanine symporter
MISRGDTMPDYKEEVLTGKKWVRSYAFQGTNTYKSIPTLRFEEEIIRELVDGTMLVNGYGSGVSANMTTPDKVIVLRNPTDDSVIPSIEVLVSMVGCTYTLVQVLMYSLYKQLATERDESGVIPKEFSKSGGIVRF